MRKFFYFVIIILFFACGEKHTRSVVVNIVDDIPAGAPVLPQSSILNVDDFSKCIHVHYCGDSVTYSALPQGVEAMVNGANILFRSTQEGVEFRLSGNADYASFELHSEKTPLVTLEGVRLFSRDRAALLLASSQTMFLRSVGDTINYIMDGVPGDTLLNTKKAAAVQLMGNAVLCGDAKLSLRGERKAAMHASGSLLLDDVDLTIEMARADGIKADSGLVVAGGQLTVNSWKDALKSKAGSVVLLDGEMNLNGMGKKGDAMQAYNVFLFGGNMKLDVKGEASRGINSKGSVYILGGNLNVTASGNAIYSPKKNDYTSGACIKSEKNFYMGAGNVRLSNSGLAGKGINCNGLLQISGGELTVDVSGDDVVNQTDRNIHASAKGIKCDSAMLIAGGDVRVHVYGRGERCEGIESKYEMTIAGNDTKVYVYAFDDAINAGKFLNLDGGKIYAYSVANDAIDGNDKISINGGLTIANGSTSPEQGIDTDYDALFSVKGGTLLSVGGMMGPAMCLPRSNDTSQPVVAWTGINIASGDYINVATDAGDVICSYKLPRDLHFGGVLFSSPLMQCGNGYSIWIGDSVADTQYVGNGMYESGRVDECDAFEWVQQTLVALIGTDGNVQHLQLHNKNDKAGNMPPPPPPFGDAANGNMPPPPTFGGAANGNMPSPPPFGKAGDEKSNVSGGYNAYGKDNLPGGGWY